jgi:hypothetical protein
MTTVYPLSNVLMILIIVGVVARGATTDNEWCRVRFSDQNQFARIEFSKKIHMDLVVLLCRPPLAIVSCSSLKLDALKGNNIGAWRVGVQITTSANGGGSWGDLRALVTLRGMLD